MNVIQLENLNDFEWIVLTFRVKQGENIADIDYWTLKRQAEKVDWKLAVKGARHKEIKRVINETK